MSQTTSGRSAERSVADHGFEFQGWDVYRAALEVQQLVPRLVPKRGHAAFRDQLDRASSSILANLAEGAGRFARADKAKYYVIARGSASECAALLDVLLSRGLLDVPLYRHAQGLLARVCQMLTKLALRMQA